jgi:hypothetical protein
MEKVATELATRIMAADSLRVLNVLGAEVKAICNEDPKFKKAWRDWLFDMWTSRKEQLLAPDWKETLNEKGKAWAEKEGL